MKTYILSADEAKSIRILAEELQKTYTTVNNVCFDKAAHNYSFKLPISLISDLANFRGNDKACFRVRGLLVEDAILGKTPESWRADRSEEGHICEFMHYLLASHLGALFAGKHNKVVE